MGVDERMPSLSAVRPIVISVLVEAGPPPQSPLRKVTDPISTDPAADHSVRTLAARAVSVRVS